MAGLVDIVRLDLRDPAGGITPVYFSSGLRWPKIAGVPSSERISGPVAISSSVGAQLLGGSGSRAGEARFDLANPDGALDPLFAKIWSGSAIRVWRVPATSGPLVAEPDDAARVFTGRIAGATADRQAIRVVARDLSTLYDRRLPIPRHDGTGGTQGPEELAGRVMPARFGRNIAIPLTPFLLDGFLLIYRLHYRRIEEVEGVWDQAVSLTFDADYPDYAMLAGAVVPAGRFATALAAGLVRLGAKPQGLVVADIKGDAEGGYIEAPADILARLRDIAGVAEIGFDAAAMAALGVVTAAEPIALDFAGEVTTAQAMERATSSIGAFWRVDRLGRLSAGLYDLSAMPTIAASDADIADLAPGDAIRPVKTLDLAWQPIRRIHEANEVSRLEPEDIGVESGATRNVNRGAWAIATVYAIGDIVSRGAPASGFSALVPHTSDGANGPPGANWALLAAAGGDGAAGTDGAAGAPGADGLSVAELVVFRRVTFPPPTPVGGAYDFSTQVLTPPASWSSAIPAGSDPVYSSRAVAAVQGTAGIDSSLAWSAAVLMVQDGSGVDVIFARSVTQPATPAPSAGVPAGWSSDPATAPGIGPRWSSVGGRPNAGANWTWQSPVIIEGTTNWRGIWSGSVTYQPGDSVDFNGTNYLALAVTVVGESPATVPAKWQILAGQKLAEIEAGADVTGTHKSLSVDVPDTRFDNELPPFYRAKGRGVYPEFKQRTSIGGPGVGTFVLLTTEVKWNDTTGGKLTQWYSDQINDFYQRLGAVDDMSWDAWIRVEAGADVTSGASIVWIDKPDFDVPVGTNPATFISATGGESELAIVAGAPQGMPGNILQWDATGVARSFLNLRKVPVAPGQKFAVEFFVKGGTAGTAAVRAFFLDSAGVVITTAVGPSVAAPFADWTRVSGTITVPADPTIKTIQLGSIQIASPTGTWFFAQRRVSTTAPDTLAIGDLSAADAQSRAAQVFAAFDATTSLRETVRILQQGGGGIARAVTNGAAIGIGGDGDSFIFSPPRPDVPIVEAANGGGSDRPNPAGALAGLWPATPRVRAINATTSGFTLEAIWRAQQSSRTPVTDTGATAGSPGLKIEKSVAAEAVGDYLASYTGTVDAATEDCFENPLNPPEIICNTNPTNVTYTLDTRATSGSAWIARKSITRSNNTLSPLAVSGIIAATVSGLGIDAAWRIRVSSGNGTLNSMPQVAYEIPGASADVTESLTPAGTDPILFRVISGQEDTVL